jgi:hypothetical protein
MPRDALDALRCYDASRWHRDAFFASHDVSSNIMTSWCPKTTSRCIAIFLFFIFYFFPGFCDIKHIVYDRRKPMGVNDH